MADEAAPTVNDGKGLPLICIDSSEHSIRALECEYDLIATFSLSSLR